MHQKSSAGGVIHSQPTGVAGGTSSSKIRVCKNPAVERQSHRQFLEHGDVGFQSFDCMRPFYVGPVNMNEGKYFFWYLLENILPWPRRERSKSVCDRFCYRVRKLIEA